MRQRGRSAMENLNKDKNPNESRTDKTRHGDNERGGVWRKVAEAFAAPRRCWFQIGPSPLFCSKGGVLNVPPSWQPQPQCWLTFLEDHCSRSSTWFPVALSTRLLRHDRSCCYLWLLFAIFSFLFLYNFHFLLPCPSPLHSSSVRVIEVRRTEPLNGALAWEQVVFLSAVSHGPRCADESSCRSSCFGTQLWMRGRCRCASSLSSPVET